jgi:hypothetical protein
MIVGDKVIADNKETEITATAFDETGVKVYNVKGNMKDYYISRIAYRMQELALGGLKVSTKKMIAEICDSTQKHKALPPYGTRIVREYKGVEHSVKIVMGGFEYNGMKYKSLSSIAKLITGTKISGNYFFGLERYKE